MTFDVDRRGHSPGAAVRPVQSEVGHIVVHKIGAVKLLAHMRLRGWLAGRETDPFAVVERFFVEDAEGVSTTTLPGSYADKRPTVREWYESGIPAENLQRAHVPYHLVVARDGQVAHFVDFDRATAHAGNRAVNASSVAVACVGDFVEEAPTGQQMIALQKVCRDLLVRYPRAEIVGHSDVSRKKGCPGRGMPLDRVRSWARTAADAVENGWRRR
jgi:hypothetical protein